MLGWISSIAKSAPYTDKFSGLIATLEYKLVNKYLICIDDLERKSKDLSIREIMGLIDELATQKQCKAIILFNDKSLTRDDEEEFQQYREKVVDIEIEYDPSHTDALSAVFSADLPEFQQIASITQVLKITNIRVLKKLKRVMDYFKDALLESDPIIFKEFSTHAAIIVWAHYMPTEAINYELLKKRLRSNPWEGFLPNNSSEEDNRYSAISRELNINKSIFSDFIIEYLEKGYLDMDAAKAEVTNLKSKIEVLRAHEELSKIWSEYSSSFNDDGTSILDKFETSVAKNIKQIELNQFSSSIEIIQNLGGDITNSITNYVLLHKQKLETMHKEEVSQIRFLPLREAIEKILKKNDSRNIDEVISAICTNRDISPENVAYLSSITEDELKEWMLTNPDDMFKKISNGLLFFGKLLGNDDKETEKYTRIYETTKKALKSIASQNKINHLRVTTLYGIEINSNNTKHLPQ